MSTEDQTAPLPGEEPPDLEQSPTRALLGAVAARLRGGELGPLPVVISLAAIWTYFDVQDQHFLTSRNLSNLVLQIAVIGTIAIGIVFVLLLGEIDLSVGSVAGATSAVLGVTVVSHGWPWWLGIAAMLLTGLAIGVFQGAWFALIGVPPFVVTLAGNLGWLGLQLHVLGANGTVNVFDPHISDIATTYLPVTAGWILAVVLIVGSTAFRARTYRNRRRAGLRVDPLALVILETSAIVIVVLAVTAVLNAGYGVPTAGVILLCLVMTFAWIANRTAFGRYVYAVGGSVEASRRAGVNIAAIRIAVFGLAGFFAAVGGLLSVSRGAAASTQTGGGTLLLEAIAAAVVGGTSLFGGRGTVWAALLGALVIGSVSNGLDLLGQSADIKYMVEGAILLLAITLDAISRRGRETSGR
jgi:D-xylose transport system permease protein